jgi:hypothetical protein
MNKNMLLSGTAAFFISALVAELSSRYFNSDLLNTILTIASGFAVSIPIFVVLSYYDIRRRFTDSKTGKANYVIINQLYKRAIEIGSLYNVVYIISRFLPLYYLLNIPIAAFEASMISSLSSSAISYTVVNVIARKFGIFRFIRNAKS